MVRTYALSQENRKLYVVAEDLRRQSTKNSRVVSIDVETRHEREIVDLSDRPLQIRGLSVSPDDRTLAVMTVDPTTSRWTLLVGSTDGGVLRESSLDAGGPIWWTRDSRAMLSLAPAMSAMSAQLNGPPPQRTRLVSIDAGTLTQKDLISLSDGMTLRGPIGLSPDGRRVAVVTSEAKTSRASVTVVGIDGTDHRQWALPFEPSGGPVWTSADQLIQLSRLSGNVVRVMRLGINGGEPGVSELRVEAGPPGGYAVISPDGNRVAILASASESNELLAIDNVLQPLKP